MFPALKENFWSVSVFPGLLPKLCHRGFWRGESVDFTGSLSRVSRSPFGDMLICPSEDLLRQSLFCSQKGRAGPPYVEVQRCAVSLVAHLPYGRFPWLSRVCTAHPD